MKINYKKIMIIILVIISMIVVYKIPKFLINKYNEPLPEVKLREINTKKSFAIMVQNGDSYEEYTNTDNTWPGEEYEFKEAKCTDNNGNIIDNAITYEEETNTVILETDKTISCTLYFDKSTLGKLRDNEKLANKNNLSSDKQGGMYRYQGTDDVDNWICFGTNDNCGTNANLIDKYMYRIIGITEEGELYLLKETFIKEGTSTSFAWNSKYNISDCLGEICEWPNVDLYKRINGVASNGNPIFINNNEYEYMAQGNDWYNLIEEHNWMYGDTRENSSAKVYNGNEMYAIETGNAATSRGWPDEEQGQTTCSSDSLCTEKPYTWSNDKSIPAKIGLMYMHDVDYAYYDGSQDDTRGNPWNDTNVYNSWINFQKDGYNTSSNYEWLISRYGIFSASNAGVGARDVANGSGSGYLDGSYLTNAKGVRPVFYLSSKEKIASGDGTKENPFILEIN